MATTTYPHYRRHPGAEAHGARDALARARAALPLAGRLLFTLLFFVSVPGHFDDSGVAYAASQGVPVPEILVPFSGVLLLVGGASIALGFHARIGALLLMAFLVPVTFFMHRFW
ncbi:MAG TPA: DoxX family protein, partial [Polyangiaceae bacterium]